MTNYIRAYRKNLGLTQKELGYLIGHDSHVRVSQLENGKVTPSFKESLIFNHVFQKSSARTFQGYHSRVSEELMFRVMRLEEYYAEIEQTEVVIHRRQRLRKIRRYLQAIEKSHIGKEVSLIGYRVGIAVSANRLAFCIIETQSSLILDFGAMALTDRDIQRIAKTLWNKWQLHRPIRVQLECVNSPECKLSQINVRLVREIKCWAIEQSMTVSDYAWDGVKETLGLPKLTGFDEVARHLGDRFSALSTLVPPKRQGWEPEHHNMILFKAAALAVTHKNPAQA